ncbi:MAG: hypothetical protein ISR65_16175 [Bacteriovoracaceae bacterium]|nr:hypothetical protein [Bacteriovoracaceae bacterium]
MVKSIFVFILILTGIQNVFSCDQHGKTGIVPENNLYIGVDAKNASTVTEEQFNQVLDRINEIYAPILEAKGKELNIVRNWSSGTVNAYAQQSGNTWTISMFGGLARHDAVTIDSFALVACHEMGHHLGGLPKKSSWWGGSSWASAEGQSDYFGSTKCLKHFFSFDNNDEIVATMEIDPKATELCNQAFNNSEDAAICARSGMAGQSLGNLFKALSNQTTPISFDTPDTNEVSSTNSAGYPATQCRFDTYFQGALCDKTIEDEVSDEDINQGVCTRAENYQLGARPRCWFKPEAI